MTFLPARLAGRGFHFAQRPCGIRKTQSPSVCVSQAAGLLSVPKTGVSRSFKINRMRDLILTPAGPGERGPVGQRCFSVISYEGLSDFLTCTDFKIICNKGFCVVVLPDFHGS